MKYLGNIITTTIAIIILMFTLSTSHACWGIGDSKPDLDDKLDLSKDKEAVVSISPPESDIPSGLPGQTH